MNERTLLILAVTAISEYFRTGAYADNFDSKELANIVIAHAAAAGLSAMAAGVLPGVGSLIAIGICTGAIWTMYIRIGAYLHLSIGLDVLKAIAAAVLANIATQLAGILVLELALGFVPGAAILIGGAVNFAVTYIAGIIYLFALESIFKAGGDPSKMSAAEMKKHFKAAAKDVNVKTAFSEAKKTFTQMNEDGSLQKEGGSVNIQTD